MVGTKQTFKSVLNPIALFAVGMILILATACGSSDEDLPATASTGASLVSDTTPLESEAIVDDDLSQPEAEDSSTTDVRIAPAQAVVPMTEPEPGSDEEAILNVLERVTLSIRSEDTTEYVESCNPSRAKLSEAQVEFVFESVFSQLGELAGINHRDVTVRTFKDDTAITESVMYEYNDVLMSRYQYSFSKVDGNWYADTNCK